MAKGRWEFYRLEGETLTRARKTCPKCGPGTFLADHGDRLTCGACKYSELTGGQPKVGKPGAKPEKKKKRVKRKKKEEEEKREVEKKEEEKKEAEGEKEKGEAEMKEEAGKKGEKE